MGLKGGSGSEAWGLLGFLRVESMELTEILLTLVRSTSKPRANDPRDSIFAAD